MEKRIDSSVHAKGESRLSVAEVHIATTSIDIPFPSQCPSISYCPADSLKHGPKIPTRSASKGKGKAAQAADATASPPDSADDDAYRPGHDDDDSDGEHGKKRKARKQPKKSRGPAGKKKKKIAVAAEDSPPTDKPGRVSKGLGPALNPLRIAQTPATKNVNFFMKAINDHGLEPKPDASNDYDPGSGSVTHIKELPIYDDRHIVLLEDLVQLYDPERQSDNTSTQAWSLVAKDIHTRERVNLFRYPPYISMSMKPVSE